MPFELPDLDNKQLMFNAGVDWHLTVPAERMNRLISHYQAMTMVKNIPGEIVECGVFKGESLLRFAHFRDILGTQSSSKIIAFDNFNDIYPDTSYDVDQAQRQHWMETAGSSSISTDQLDKVLKKKNITNYELIAGDITKTVPEYVSKNKGLKIALLNIDCDFTEPTFTSLKYFWDHMSVGGIILLDNYGGWGTSDLSYHGDTKGTDDFIQTLENKPQILKFNYVDRPCYIIKK